jgi:hypothetical protein
MSSVVNIISNTTFDSELKIPSGWTSPTSLNFENYGAPPNNAALTLKLRYKLNFADSKNRVPGVVVIEGAFKVRHADGFAHPILDWDQKSRATFASAFERGEKIWSRKFLLLTPSTYNGFDFSLPDDPTATVRPNVVCLFVMSPSDSNPHIEITVFRIDRDNDAVPFRSHSKVYDDLVPWTPTLGHELGHAIGIPHIKVILGDAQCTIEPNADRCYGETEEEMANVMGSGTKLLPLNAGPWLDRIAAHTMTPRSGWTATLDMRTQPEIYR